MASVAAGTEAVGRLEAALATAEATGVVAAPVASPLVDEGDTVGEERAVMAGAATVLPQEGMVAARVAAPAPVEARPPGTQRPCLGLPSHHIERRST